MKGKVRKMAYRNDSKNSRRNTYVSVEDRKPLEKFPRFNQYERVYIPDKNRFGNILRVEFDPKWGPQLYVRILPNEGENWVEEEAWLRHTEVERYRK